MPHLPTSRDKVVGTAENGVVGASNDGDDSDKSGHAGDNDKDDDAAIAA